MSEENYKSIYDFNPIMMGTEESLLWKEYYARKYYKMFKRSVKVFKYISKKNNFLDKFVAALMIALSSFIFIIAKHSRHKHSHIIILCLSLFNRSINNKTNFNRTALNEYRWWQSDRKYNGQKSEIRRGYIATTLSSLYELPKESFNTFAEKWEDAALLFDNIAGQEVEKGDWKKCEELLIEAYTSLHEVVNNKQTL